MILFCVALLLGTWSDLYIHQYGAWETYAGWTTIDIALQCKRIISLLMEHTHLCAQFDELAFLLAHGDVPRDAMLHAILDQIGYGSIYVEHRLSYDFAESVRACFFFDT